MSHRYEISFNHTQRFIQWKYNVDDIDITMLDYEFISEYEFWLKTVRNCGHNTTMKYLANFKKILLICVKNGWLQKDPFFSYKFSKKDVVREYLSENELKTMQEKPFASERLERVRDIFLFCCYTGLAYADVKKLKRSEIQVGVDGKKWIFTFRQKTDTPVTNTIVEIVQTIKQNKAGIRNTPGTALKNAINGEVVYMPPCCEDVLREKLSALEQFINNDTLSHLDPLIKMALVHYQFEAIHPFSDGNGRTGRILSTLYLVQQGLLPQPVLYLSSYITSYKTEYYRLLREVSEKANWHDWIMFTLSAVAETAKLTTTKIRKLLLLKDKIEAEAKRVLGSSYSTDLLQLMFKQPYLKIELLEKMGIAHRQTASTWLKKLADANVLHPQKVGRTTYFINRQLMNVISSNEL